MSVPLESSPVNEMLAALERSDRPLWPLPILHSLEAISPDSAMDFVVAFIRSQLHRVETADELKLREQWLADFDTTRSASPGAGDAAAINSAAREIWYSFVPRDWSKLAICRVYEALGVLLTGDRTKYCMTLAVAVRTATSDGGGIPYPASLAKLIELYNAAMSGK